MDSPAAIVAFAALAHETRLALFRALIGAGETGMTAGDIARTLDVSPSTLSHHLAQLEHAHIIASRRASRHIYYAVNMDRVRDLLGFLIEDCCEGAPDLCGFTRTKATCHAD